MDAETLLLLVAGIAALVAGAETLVRGAARLAAAAGVSPLVVGLTVVAYGTGTPELAVSVRGAIAGQPDIALGNVVGSNILNVLLVLGASALLSPLVIRTRLVRLDVPLMIGVSTLPALLGLDGRLGVLDGIVLGSGLLAYTVFTVREGRRDAAGAGGPPALGGHWSRQVGLVGLGLGLLLVGAEWFVGASVALARAAGVSELAIGLTLVAAGTSMPEIATSLIAALRGERDIAVGNVVGSNIYNVLAVLGVSTLAAGGTMSVAPVLLRFDVPVMLAAAVACLPVFLTGHRIARWEGGLFLFYYLAYTLYVLLDAAGHDALPAFSATMGLFVIPLTVVTLVVATVRAWRGAG